MAQVTSGQVLRETRERKGYDLNTVSQRLRIRADILRAIEANDFSNMPSRGYTKNMINAYARLLGLNPTEIVNMFMSEAYANQVKRVRNTTQSSGFYRSRDRASRVTKRPVSSPATTGSIYGDLDNPEYKTETTRSSRRRLFDDRTQYSRDDYGIPRSSERRTSTRSNRDYLSNHSGYAIEDDFEDESYGSSYGTTRDSSLYAQRRHQTTSERRRRGQIYAGQTPMSYSKPSILSNIMSHLPLILGILIVAIVIAAILFFVFGGNKDQSSSDVSTLPVSGITDTTGTADGSDDDEITVEVAPTSARIVMTVGDGESVYIETYDGEDATAEYQILDGPSETTVETKGTWTITTWTPDLIRVTVNGDAVKLTSNENYGGMYAYTVDFQKILQEWQSTHNNKTSARSAALASAATAAEEDEKTKEAEKQAEARQAAKEAAEAAAAQTESNQ